ncbi:HlyD family efflux transporter periplasmic adaptor subunit [Pontibacter actiniarum]|nr:HlyD family efflux transporter periplasmic adaptor subunit [Pontibacter actiniarum]
MEEIIGRVPHWITRWGVTILFIVSVIGVGISNTISFPDSVSAEVLIQAKEQPGKVLLKRDDANQEFIFHVKEEDWVTPGDTLFVHKNDSKNICEAITTPMAGRVFIAKGIDASNTQDYVVWVVPETTDFEIKLLYPVKGSGRIILGQEVVITVDNYPTADFGFLTGKITKILPVPVEGKVQSYVTLDTKKLRTNLGQELPIKYSMVGKAEIILENKTIAGRIFGNIMP